jgi:hypothetical protein
MLHPPDNATSLVDDHAIILVHHRSDALQFTLGPKTVLNNIFALRAITFDRIALWLLYILTAVLLVITVNPPHRRTDLPNLLRLCSLLPMSTCAATKRAGERRPSHTDI